MTVYSTSIPTDFMLAKTEFQWQYVPGQTLESLCPEYSYSSSRRQIFP